MRILFIFLLALIIYSCGKPEGNDPYPGEYFTSVQTFLNESMVKADTHFVRSDTVETFRTQNGTDIWIQPNSFMNQNGVPITGPVRIEFTELYSKTEMMLSGLSTQLINGRMMKSGGMFLMKASVNDSAVVLSPGKSISISQLLKYDESPDFNMKSYTRKNSNPVGWYRDSNSVQISSTEYNYDFSRFMQPLDYGTWSSAGDESIFSYPLTTLKVHALFNLIDYFPIVYLISKNERSVVRMNYTSGQDFNYNYAPLSLQCTIVAFTVHDGKLYSCIKPVTITENLIVNISLSPTSKSEFISRVDSL